MSNRRILSAMAVALLVLAGAGAYLAFFNGGSAAADGSISDDCQQYALDNAQHASIHDQFIKGIVTIGFKEGPDSPQAALLLRTIGTTFYMPLPYHQTAFVCVQAGREQEWVARMKALDWVEWAHVEGVHGLLTLPASGN